jgi:hypothetical protein
MGVYHATYIVDGFVADDVYVAGVGIDFDFGDMAAVGPAWTGDRACRVDVDALLGLSRGKLMDVASLS